MAEEGIVTTDVAADPSTAKVKTPLTETPEFKAAVEEHRKNLKAEMERRAAKGEFSPAPAPRTTDTGNDPFAVYETEYGIPKEAAKRLITDAVGYVNEVIVSPLIVKQKQSDIRLQRSDLRASNVRLAKLDDQYHEEAMKLLEPVPPGQIRPDSYKRALQMVIGEHVDDITKESEGKSEGGDKSPEIIGPQPRGSKPPEKPAPTLTSFQQGKAEDMGLSADSYVEVMRDRARRMMTQAGQTKDKVRAQLGKVIEGIEF